MYRRLVTDDQGRVAVGTRSMSGVGVPRFLQGADGEPDLASGGKPDVALASGLRWVLYTDGPIWGWEVRRVELHAEAGPELFKP